MNETFDVEPVRGTRIRMPSGRTFERTERHFEFRWSDGIGWYRWREVQRRAQRGGGRLLVTIDAIDRDLLAIEAQSQSPG